MRRPTLRARTRELYLEARGQLTLLAVRWQRDGLLAEDADPRAIATRAVHLAAGAHRESHLVESIPFEY